MHDASPSNAEIARALVRVGQELSTRYGIRERGTRMQLAKTIGDLGIDAKVAPYVYAAFTEGEALSSLETELADVNWVEVSNRIKHLDSSMPRGRDGGDFYESRIAFYGTFYSSS